MWKNYAAIDIGVFHKAILVTIDLSYLRLIVRLPALLSVPRNNFKMIVIILIFHLTG